jgi:hypothetical protein
MLDTTYTVLSGGHYVKVAVSKDEAYQAAADHTRGRIEVVQGTECPVTACVYNDNHFESDVLPTPVAMFENGEQVPIP